MIVGKIRIKLLRELLKQNTAIHNKIRRKVSDYKDKFVRMLFNMIKISTIFGHLATAGPMLAKISI